MPDDVIWTAREAMACAYCWSEFNAPENTVRGSPEQYWLGISAKARADCRTIANRRLLLATARGDAVPVLGHDVLSMGEFTDLGDRLGIKLHHRIRKAVDAVRAVYGKRCADAG